MAAAGSKRYYMQVGAADDAKQAKKPRLHKVLTFLLIR